MPINGLYIEDGLGELGDPDNAKRTATRTAKRKGRVASPVPVPNPQNRRHWLGNQKTRNTGGNLDAALDAARRSLKVTNYTLTPNGTPQPTGPRPSSNASSYSALRGDVIRFDLQIGYGLRTSGYTKGLTTSLQNKLTTMGFQVLQLDDSDLNFVTGGSIKGNVQINSNGFGNIQDAANVIGGLAAQLGYNVTRSSAEFVNRYQDNPSFKPDSTIAPPGSDPNKHGSMLDGLTKALEGAFGGSGMTLGLLAALAVVVLVTKK
jgi:hypothetical protein